MLYDPRWKTASRQRSKKAPDIYRAAADLIEQRGHSKGLLQDERGRVCLWGAISVVMDGSAFKCSAGSYRLMEDLRQFTRGKSPVGWNNSPSRRKRQVVNLLRKAAEATASQ